MERPRESSSPWRLTLLDALGHELRPEAIKIEKLPEAYELEFFPAKTPFSKTYSVRFTPASASDFAGMQLRCDHASHRQPDRPHRADLAGLTGRPRG